MHNHALSHALCKLEWGGKVKMEAQKDIIRVTQGIT